jgi:hypothetical protein
MIDRFFGLSLVLAAITVFGILIFAVYSEQKEIHVLKVECREKIGILVSYGNDYFCMPAPQSIPLKGTTK